MDLTYEIPESIKTGVLVNELNDYKCIEPEDNPYIDIEYYSGGFCQTYPLIKNGSKKKCLRLWIDDAKMGDLEHVRQVASYFTNNTIKYVIPYRYYEKALRLNNGIEIPGVVMDWIDGDKFIDYIRKHCREPKLMKTLSENFYNMVSYLNSKGMSHGDLSGDNIIVKPDGSLCLIDYDSFFVPGFENVKQPTKGTGGYQHPERKQSVYLTKTMDYFSQQVIYLSILGIAMQPEIIDNFGEKEMLFSEMDLMNVTNFKKSRSYQALMAKNVYVIKKLLNQLESAISSSLDDVKSLVTVINIYADGIISVQNKHRIRIRQANNFILLTSPLTEARAGENITITCINEKPDEYRIKGFNVITSNGVWRLGSQRYFNMPDCDVTIEAEFEKITIAFTSVFKLSIKCDSCNTYYYKSYSKYCHHCGKKRT